MVTAETPWPVTTLLILLLALKFSTVLVDVLIGTVKPVFFLIQCSIWILITVLFLIRPLDLLSYSELEALLLLEKE